MTTPAKPLIPPHANAAAHARIMAWLEKATPEEVFQSAVAAGIYSPDGRLLPPYADDEGDEGNEPPARARRASAPPPR